MHVHEMFDIFNDLTQCITFLEKINDKFINLMKCNIKDRSIYIYILSLSPIVSISRSGGITRAAFEKEVRAVIVNIGLMQMRA